MKTITILNNPRILKILTYVFHVAINLLLFVLIHNNNNKHKYIIYDLSYVRLK